MSCFENKNNYCVLSYDDNFDHKPIFIHNTKFLHFKNFDKNKSKDDTELSGCERIEISHKKLDYCSESINRVCHIKLNKKENITFPFDSFYDAHKLEKLNGRCDDVIVLENDVYFIECKNSSGLNCRPFLQLASTTIKIENCVKCNDDKTLEYGKHYSYYYCISKMKPFQSVHTSIGVAQLVRQEKNLHSDNSPNFKARYGKISKEQPVVKCFTHQCKGHIIAVCYHDELTIDHIKDLTQNHVI